jgi:hypothetical protein
MPLIQVDNLVMSCPYCSELDNCPWTDEEEVTIGTSAVWCCKVCGKHYKATLDGNILIKTTPKIKPNF